MAARSIGTGFWLGAGLLPGVFASTAVVAADHGVAGIAQGATPAISGLNPAGSPADALCEPLYGKGKDLGVPLIVEGPDGRALESLTGYEFEIRAADGTTQSIPLGEGTGPGTPANISSETMDSSETLGVGLSLVRPANVHYLNCSPPGAAGIGFPEGTLIVAMKDGADISSGSLAGRFPPVGFEIDLLAALARDAMLEIIADGCDATDTTFLPAWRNFATSIGLTYSADLALMMITELVELVPTPDLADLCVPDPDISLLDEIVLAMAVLQGMGHDYPLGLLESSGSVIPSAYPPWADAGFLGPVRLENPVFGDDSDDILPGTGRSMSPTLLVAILLLTSGYVALAGTQHRRIWSSHSRSPKEPT